MPNDPSSQPTQPLTDAERSNIEARWSRYVQVRDSGSMETSVHDVPDLLDEVDRLRAENTAQAARIAELAAEVIAVAGRNCTLQSENDLLRALGLDLDGGGA